MYERAEMVLTKEEIERLTVKVAHNTEKITLDLHGLTVKQAHRLIKNIIALDRKSFCIDLVHGYSHGTAIKDMITDFCNPRVLGKSRPDYNPGITKMLISAA